MMRKVRAIIMAFFMSAGPGAGHAQPNSEPNSEANSGMAAMIAKVSASIVMIDAVDSGGRVVRGAGFIINTSGQIATAYHVVEAAASIRLMSADGRSSAARVASFDSPYDLAVLTADVPPAAPPLVLSSIALTPGVPVVAIGYPFGHAFSASAGIISGLDRTYDPLTPHGFLQHDAALNPGSSGGPLLDANGQVVGINAAIPNGRRSDVGVGFAIPATIAQRVLKALLDKGELQHGYLGARLRIIDHALASAMGRNPGGAAIEEVEKDGPADKAGLRPGDLIAAMNGRPIGDLRRVAEAVTGGEPGDSLVLEGVRSLSPLKLTISLGRTQAHGPSRLTMSAASMRTSGIEFANINAPVIKSVVPQSPAGIAGLKKGDEVLAVGARNVASASDARQAMDQTKGPLALLIRRPPGGARYVALAGPRAGPSGSPFAGNREAEGSLPF